MDSNPSMPEESGDEKSVDVVVAGERVGSEVHEVKKSVDDG